MNSHKFLTNSSIILIICIVIGTGILLAAFVEFISSSHTYHWIRIKFTFWIYHLIQQESTECFLNCPDSFRIDEVLFQSPNLSTNKHQQFNLVHAWNQIQEIVTNVIHTSKFSCVTLLVSLQKKVHVLTYVVSAEVGSLVLSQTLYTYIYIYTCYEIFMLFE